MASTLVSSPSRLRSATRSARLAGPLLAVALATAPAAGAGADVCSGRAWRRSAATPQADPRAALAAAGVWVDVPRYGAAWRPCAIDPGWRPYFHGSWRWKPEGWFWVSAEPWGDVTHHYGRWLFDASNGWVWLPGKTKGPAWVRWSWNAEVIGWAPLEPDGTTYSAFWTFVPATRFAGEQVEAVAFPAPRIPALLLKTSRTPRASTRSARMCSPAAPCPFPPPPPPARSTS